ncbi:MAG: hypothetical protein EZS28_002357, partial [Streblomastix strix]
MVLSKGRTLTDTKEKYIAIYSMCAITYLLPISCKSIPSIKQHLSKKRQCFKYVNSSYPNTCVLEAIARYQLKYSKEKRYGDKQVLAKMKEIGNLFYGEFNPRTFEDDSSFRYHLAQSFSIETDNEINFLLIQSEQLNGINIHTLLVTDKERLTGLLFCPICQNHCFQVDSRTKENMAKHIEKCRLNKDTSLMVEPIKNLINLFFEYKVDMIQFISMASCANAVKYSIAYNEFKLDGDYCINMLDPPF